eukprot:8606922-Alexandrium_andersonii.AAC.1
MTLWDGVGLQPPLRRTAYRGLAMLAATLPLQKLAPERQVAIAQGTFQNLVSAKVQAARAKRG